MKQPRTSFFWEDWEQAMERLPDTTVLFNNEPVLIIRIENAHPEPPVATLCKLPDITTPHRVSLADPGFKLFRELPTLGWLNYADNDGGLPSSFYCYRIPVRSRLHGLGSHNVRVDGFYKDNLVRSQDHNFASLYSNDFIINSMKGNYPNSREILETVPNNCALAFSNKGAIYRDDIGIRWLYINAQKVGFFTEPTVLQLPQKFAFMKEEIESQPNLVVTQIKEAW